MRFVPLIFLGSLALWGFSLRGEIGASQDQCIARYGKPERDALKESGLLYFRKNGICTIVHFYKGKCDVLSLFSDKAESGVPEELPSDRIMSLLKSEGSSPDWSPAGCYSINGVWNTADGKSFAIYDTMRHKLAIMTHEAYVREKAAVAKARSGGN
jgi:hypothetical protein